MMSGNQSVHDADNSSDSGRYSYILVETTLPDDFQETSTIRLSATETKVREIDFIKYDKENITSVVIPEGIEKIGYFAFFNQSSLVSMTFGGSITEIDDQAFACCESLKVIYVKTRDEEVFERIRQLLPENLRGLAKQLFSNAKSARSVIEHDEAQCDSRSSARVNVVAQSGMFAKRSKNEPGEEAIASPSCLKN